MSQALTKPQNGPYPVSVLDGQSYRWCRCGLSNSQPWCDDSHVGSKLVPIEFTAPITEIFYMCGCKASSNPPFCFGNCRAHANKLPSSL